MEDVLFSRLPSSSFSLYILPRSFLLGELVAVILLLTTRIARCGTVPSIDVPESIGDILDGTEDFAKGGVL